MTKLVTALLAFSTCLLPPTVAAFTTPRGGIVRCARPAKSPPSSVRLSSTPNKNNNINNDPSLAEKFGGYTVKQRLREEVESPFRKVRLAFFSFSAASASVALYFSALAALKANIGGYADAIPLEDALQTCAINAAGVVGLGALAIREANAGQANLERIARGGLLARLEVEPASSGRDSGGRRALGDYRRASRVVIAAGGAEYVARLAMSLCSDQLSDTNTLPGALAGVDTIVVPVLLDGKCQAVDTRDAWRNAMPGSSDRNFDASRADEIVAFPAGFASWNQYLKSDVETARKQGFDVLEKGITITVKKNGRILRRYE